MISVETDSLMLCQLVCTYAYVQGRRIGFWIG